MSDNLKLYYFDAEGRGELIRLLFAAVDRSFEDIRLDFTQWPEYKTKMLLGQLPVLELPDKTQIPQSVTIARYVARQLGLAGSDDIEAAKIDAVVDTQMDLNNAFYFRVFTEKDETRKSVELEKCFDENLVQHLANLDKLKKAFSQDGKHFVGKRLSWADLFVFQSYSALVKALPQMKDKVGDYFQALVDTVQSNGSLKKYLDNRPVRAFWINFTFL